MSSENAHPRLQLGFNSENTPTENGNGKFIRVNELREIALQLIFKPTSHWSMGTPSLAGSNAAEAVICSGPPAAWHTSSVTRSVLRAKASEVAPRASDVNHDRESRRKESREKERKRREMRGKDGGIIDVLQERALFLGISMAFSHLSPGAWRVAPGFFTSS